MSKRFAFVLILLYSVLFLSIKVAKAVPPVDNCPNPIQASAENWKSNSKILNSNSENATFTNNIGKFYDSKINKWEMQFECGPEAFQQSVEASLGPDLQTLTSKKVQRSRIPYVPGVSNPAGCEFFPGDRTLLIKGDGVPRCRGKYFVADTDSTCSLSIDPETGITPLITIKVSGQDLTDGGQFGLFIDTDGPFMFNFGMLNINANPLPMIKDNFVSTPSFSDITLPKDKLTPTKHTVYVKRYQVTPPIDWSIIFPPAWVAKNGYPFGGPRLCSIDFTVGTTDHPGQVTGRSSGFSTKKCGDAGVTCSTGGGKKADGCTGNPNDPAIATAIGCIHTSPAALTKDVLTFTIGIGGGLAFLMMLLGAFQMLTSAGNPETLKAGQDRLTSAVIGLHFVIFSILLLQIIGAGVLKIPGFTP